MEPAPSPAAAEARPPALRGLVHDLAGYVSARLRLAEIESREAGARIAVLAILACICAGSLLTAWLIAVPALIFLMAETSGWHWHRVALITAALHLFAALVCLAAARSRARRLRFFEETIKQFDKDRACLAPPQK